MSAGLGRKQTIPQSIVEILEMALLYLDRDLAVQVEPFSKLLTPGRVGDLLGMDRSYVKELIAEGKLPLASDGKRVELRTATEYQEKIRLGLV